MKDEIQTWLIEWLRKRNKDSGLLVKLDDDFYKCGFVDSFGIIELIADIEDHFAIRFDDEDFQTESFRTVEGLSQIISEKNKENILMENNAVKIITDRFEKSGERIWYTSIDDYDFTYNDFWANAEKLAEKWAEEGLRKNDVIAFVLPNSFAVPCCYLACAIGGFVACPVVETLPESGIKELLDYVKPALLIRETPDICRNIGESVQSYDLEVDQDAPFLIMFTSGATGTPKAICHSFRSVVNSARAFAHLTNMSEKTRLYHILPMTYMAGFLNTMLSPLVAGASIVEGALFSPVSAMNFWTRPLKQKVNTLSIIPTAASALCRLTRDAETINNVRSSIEQIQCTSAPIPMALRQRFKKMFSLPLQDCYGITELGGPLTFQDFEDADDCGESSVPVPEIDISLRSQSELWIRSPFSMLGYLEDGKLTRPFDGDGFMNTGDLALVKNGKIKITGRVKDIIIRGGINVSPSKLESVLSLMPDVDDVAVIGHEHDFWGEEIVACVIAVDKGQEMEQRFLNFAEKTWEAMNARIKFYLWIVSPVRL